MGHFQELSMNNLEETLSRLHPAFSMLHGRQDSAGIRRGPELPVFRCPTPSGGLRRDMITPPVRHPPRSTRVRAIKYLGNLFELLVTASRMRYNLFSSIYCRFTLLGEDHAISLCGSARVHWRSARGCAAAPSDLRALVWLSPTGASRVWLDGREHPRGTRR